MRNELELIKKIEDFLTGQLPSAERAVFEKEIANNSQLQQEVQLQQQIMLGIERAAIKQKVQHASTRFKRIRRFYKGGLGGLILVTIISAVFYFNHHRNAYRDGKLPAYNEQGGTNWASADSNLVAQTFMIKAGKDTVIETQGGMVLSIPANGFLSNDGSAVNGEIEFIVKEALDAASVIKSGLSSKAGDKLLETGGMFFIDARKDGNALRINPRTSILGQIPADSLKAGMQLFRGERLANGGIDWVKPKALNHDLVPVDIKSLDFYPPHYLDSLARWGYDSHNKKFTDNLYYSLAWDTVNRAAKPANAAPFGGLKSQPESSDSSLLNNVAQKPSSPMPRDTILSGDYHICAINPAKIKAIWNDKFQNTIVSTREFEQRLYWIHKSGSDEVLDMYLNNLDKPMYKIDSMVASLHTGLSARFKKFAALHTGGINTDSRQAKKLQQYYQLKSKLFAKAAEKTRDEILKKRQAFDREADKKQNEYNDENAKREVQNFNEEFEVNLKDAYRQLGYVAPNFKPISKATYNMQITNTGWNNVDRYVYESVANRSTMNFTDKVTGKTATIKYLSAIFKIPKYKAYDRLYVYLLPDKLSSFMRISGSNGNFSEKLDELMRYRLVCIAYTGDQAFLYIQNDILPKEYGSIGLIPVEEKELKRQLNETGGKTQTADLVNEMEYFRFDVEDQKRRQRDMAADELSTRIIALISHCATDAIKIVYPKRM
jgi:hypothetical protein